VRDFILPKDSIIPVNMSNLVTFVLQK